VKFKALSVYLLLIAASILLVDFVKAQEVSSSPASSTVAAVANSEGSVGSGWGMNLFSLGGIYKQQFENRDPSINFFENYIGLSYRPNRDMRLGIRYSFTYKTDGLDEFGNSVVDANKTESSDMSLILSLKNIFEDVIPSAMELRFQPRLYLPTSDKSRAQGLIASLRLENEMKYYFSRKQVLRVYFQPRYYFQRSTSFINDKDKARTTEMAQSKHGLEFSQGVSSWFAIKPGFEIEDSWSNTSPSNNLSEYHDSNIDYRLGFEFDITRNISTTLGLSYNQDLIQTNKHDRQVTLLTNVNLF
jgi:hypothetical protein